MFSIIVAVAEDNGIGKNNKIPWDIPLDLKYFRDKTNGTTMIMGRKTFESFNKPLPNRKHIVLTHNKLYSCQYESVEVVADFNELLSRYENSLEEVFIIGGSKIYELFLPYCKKLYITKIFETYCTDTYFPEFDEEIFKLSSSSEIMEDEKTCTKFVFKVFEHK